ncbi:MAG: glycosyltransferase [Nitrospira sp.]|nr:glycosyltransferase [Nitrospira sp.]
MDHTPQPGSRKIRIAQVITGLVVGGGGQVVWTIARKIDRARFEMDIFCVIEGGELVSDIEKMGFRVNVLEKTYDYRRLLSYDVFKILKLAEYLEKGKYDIVHTHLYQADVIGRIAGIVAGVPNMVKSLHNMGQWKKKRHLIVDRLLLSKTAYVICCSDYQKEVAIRQEHLKEGKAITIYNGVDIERFTPKRNRFAFARSLGLDPTCKIVGTVGRMIEMKGQVHFLRSIQHVLAEHPDVQFVLVGDGPIRKELEGEVKNKPFRDQVFFLGERRDVPEILGIMDVFVFPSLSEGMAIAVVEAMASRLPVVASHIRPLSDIVIHEKTGLLVEPRSPHAIAWAVNRLLQDDHLRSMMGEAGRERVAQYFTDDKMVRRIEEIYTLLAASGGGC